MSKVGQAGTRRIAVAELGITLTVYPGAPMTLKTVLAVPYETMSQYLGGAKPPHLCATLAARHDRVWVCSVTNSAQCPLNVFEGWSDEPVALVEDAEDRIALRFDDIEPHADALRDSRFVYFDESMAGKVCALVHRAQCSEGSDLFIANCHAGVSRSGAIADFVRTVSGVPYEDFRRLNSQIVPNAFVRKLLFETWLGLGYALPR